MNTVPRPSPAVDKPARDPSGSVVTVGSEGIVWPLPDRARTFQVGTLDQLAAAAPGYARWRQVWLTGPAVDFFGLDRRRREPLRVGGLTVRSALWEPGCPFRGIDDAGELYRQLWRLEAALGGVGWHSSAAITSDVLLRVLHQPPRARPIDPTAMPAPGLPARKGARPAGGETPFMWHRTPLGADRGDWVHHYDLNAAYLAAASKLRLPQGEPARWQLGEDQPLRGADKYPGYWRIEPAEWNISAMPPAWGTRPKKDPELWVTTPTLKLLRDLLWPVTIREGWYWPGSCEALTPWYERLRDARYSLDGAARVAIGQIYKQGIGRLASELRSKPDDPLYQPAWAHHVIAESRARIFRRIAELSRPVLALEVDSIWVQHDDPDPERAAADLRLPLGDRLGQWKPLGRIAALEAHTILTGPARGVFARFREAERS